MKIDIRTFKVILQAAFDFINLAVSTSNAVLIYTPNLK